MKLWNLNPDILSFGPLVQKIPPRRCHATFVVKATFRLVPDGVAAPIQDEPVDPDLGPGKPEDMPHFPMGDVPAGPPAPLGETPSDVLRTASDLAPFKPRADVLVAGTAHAPDGRPVEQVRVGIRVGDLAKLLVVIGDHGLIDGCPTKVKPFTAMPLGWDRAYGGPGFERNPAGLGAVEYLLDDGRSWRPLPNIVDPKLAHADPTRPAENEPAGFGPYAPFWPQRRKGKMGTHDEAWRDEHWPWFPHDFHWSHFNAAPPDQQVEGYLRGDEAMVFENLHPQHRVLRCRLPGLRARCFLKELVETADADGIPPEAAAPQEATAKPAAPAPAPAPAIADPPLPATNRVNFGFAALDVPEPSDVEEEIRIARLKARAAFEAAKKTNTRPAKPKKEQPFRWREVPLVLDTLSVDLDAGTVNLVWRGTARLRSLRMREVGDVLLLAEPLSGPAHDKYHYLSLLERRKAEYEARFAPPAAAMPPEALEEHIQGEMAELNAELATMDAIVAREKERYAAFAEQVKATMPALAGDGLPPQPGGAGLAAMTDPTLAPHIQDFIATVARDDPAKAEVLKRELRMAIEGVPAEKRPEVAALMAQIADLDRQKEEVERRVATALEPAFGKVTGERFEDRPSFLAAVREGRDLRAADLSGLDLSHIQLSGLDLSNADLTGANLDGTLLHGARLRGARLAKAQLHHTDFSGADLEGVRFTAAKTAALCFRRAAIGHADFTELDLESADFSEVTGASPVFLDARLTHARFQNARLAKPLFQGATLDGADFSGAELTDADFFAVKARGIVMANARLPGLRACEKANFHGGVFIGIRAERSNWERAVLAEADFRDAILDDSLMNEVNARHANFDRARLRRAFFEEADLSRARLTHADLLKASFERADLTDADLSGSNAYGALFIHPVLDNTVIRHTFLRHTLLERHVRH